MRSFPVFVDLARHTVVVVGGDEKAIQKRRLLLKTPAPLTVISQVASPELKALASAHSIEPYQGPFVFGW